MKAKLEFDLAEPDERTEHMQCLKAIDALLCLHDIAENYRSHDKYETPLMTREEFRDLLFSRGIDLDNLLN